MSAVKKIANLGQQIWLDSLSRQLITSGRLQKLIDEDGIAGLTSNPAIFQQAITKDTAYKTALSELPKDIGDLERRFEMLALPDIRSACDLFLPMYRRTTGEAGYVSFEVSPQLSGDTRGTIEAARRLWKEINRPNVMIKIPATQAGLGAITQCIAEGINVNVTLMFSLKHVRNVFDAYCAGLVLRAEAGQPLANVRSVASVFISRWDARLDPLLAERAPNLCGKTAIAYAKIAYQYWIECFDGGDKFAELSKRGAAPPMLLWASTGTKNPAYRDVMYVESLIGKHTVNTVPEATLNAFLDHGEAALTLENGLEEAKAQIKRISEFGIDMDAHGELLQQEGLILFEKAFAELLSLVA